MNPWFRFLQKKMMQFKDGSVHSKAARGTLILTGGAITDRLLRVVRNMILARLLAQDDFGLYAIIMAVVTLLDSLADVGIYQSIIQQKHGAENAYLNAAWWFQACRSVFLFTTAYLAAPLIVRFYEKPELLNVLRVTFFTILLSGFVSTRITVLEKEFRYLKYTILAQGCSLFGTLLAIISVIYMRNVWVFVIGILSESILRLFLSYIFCPFIPSIHLDRGSIGELVKFTKGMLGLPFFTMITLQADVFILAKIVSGTDVGTYALVLALAQQPVMIFARTAGRVLLPTFSAEQDNRARLKNGMSKVIRTLNYIVFPLLVLGALFSKPIIYVFYGARWLDGALPLSLLFLAMFFRLQGLVFASICLALGKPTLLRKYTFLLAVILIVLLYPLVKLYGITGAAAALLIGNAIVVLLQVAGIMKYIDFHLKDYWRCWLPGQTVFVKNE